MAASHWCPLRTTHYRLLEPLVGKGLEGAPVDWALGDKNTWPCSVGQPQGSSFPYPPFPLGAPKGLSWHSLQSKPEPLALGAL